MIKDLQEIPISNDNVWYKFLCSDGAEIICPTYKNFLDGGSGFLHDLCNLVVAEARENASSDIYVTILKSDDDVRIGMMTTDKPVEIIGPVNMGH